MKKIKLVFIIICIALILIPLLMADYHGGKINKNENRYLAKGPMVFFQTGERVDLTKWINDNIGYRMQMLRIKNYFDYYWLHKSPSSNVVLGKDDFLFYTQNNNIALAQNKYPLSELEIRKTVKSLILANDILKKHNKVFIFTIAPSKPSIYPEYMPFIDYHRTVTPADIFDEKLKGKVHYINLKTPLYAEKERNPSKLLYYKTDTHWNQYGAFIAYKSIIDKMNEIGIFNKYEEYMQIKYTEDIKYGDLSNMIGADFVKPEKTMGAQIVNSSIYETDNPQYLLDLKKKYGGNIFYFQNKNEEKHKNIYVISDSMFGMWNIPQLLANHFSIYNHTMWHIFDNSIIFDSEADIVLLEIVERFSNVIYVIFDRFIALHYKPRAMISSNDIPSVMENGREYSFNITIKNTGEYNLGYDYMTVAAFLLDSNEYDKIDQGIRFNLPRDTVIKPGKEFTYRVTFTPNYKGKYLVLKVGEDMVNWISNEIKVMLK